MKKANYHYRLDDKTFLSPSINVQKFRKSIPKCTKYSVKPPQLLMLDIHKILSEDKLSWSVLFGYCYCVIYPELTSPLSPLMPSVPMSGGFTAQNYTGALQTTKLLSFLCQY